MIVSESFFSKRSRHAFLIEVVLCTDTLSQRSLD